MKDAMLITHFIGLAMGLGTSIAFMILGMASSKMEEDEGKKFMVKALALSKMGNIGITLLVISGLYLITNYWKVLGDYPLLITKLALVLVLGALLGMISAKARRAKAGNLDELDKIRPFGMLALLTALSIVVIAVLQFH